MTWCKPIYSYPKVSLHEMEVFGFGKTNYHFESIKMEQELGNCSNAELTQDRCNADNKKIAITQTMCIKFFWLNIWEMLHLGFFVDHIRKRIFLCNTQLGENIKRFFTKSTCIDSLGILFAKAEFIVIIYCKLEIILCTLLVSISISTKMMGWMLHYVFPFILHIQWQIQCQCWISTLWI